MTRLLLACRQCISNIAVHKKRISTACVLNTTKRLVEESSRLESDKVKPKTKQGHLQEGPDLKHFIQQSQETVPDIQDHDPAPYLDPSAWHGWNRKVYFDVYGCQMNVNDTDIVWSILKSAGFEKTNNINDSDIILIMTCAIREGAETKIWNRLAYLRGKKKKSKLKIGVLGCMAERLKHKLIEKEKAVDLVAGPDSYRDLPRLLALTQNDQTAVNVMLSYDETYADVMPTRLNEDSVSAFVSIQRGCDNMCTYCIVPFTRGRERSRPIESILAEVKKFSDEGVKEVTLLGQNVNSYRDVSTTHSFPDETRLAKGFKTVYKTKKGGLRFAELLDRVSMVNPEMRIRFTSPHPKDFPDEVLHLISERSNICNNLHMPAQSGNDRILERMRRGYTRASYLELIENVRRIIPNVALSSDFICGFCGETEEEFQDTLSLIREVKFALTFLFAYSMRQRTPAHRTFEDDISPEVKTRRMIEMNETYRRSVAELNKETHGQTHLVLVEGRSRKSEMFLSGRNDANQKVIIPLSDIPDGLNSRNMLKIKPGDYVAVKITESNSQCLKGIPLYHTTLTEFNIPYRDEQFSMSFN